MALFIAAGSSLMVLIAFLLFRQSPQEAAPRYFVEGDFVVIYYEVFYGPNKGLKTFTLKVGGNYSLFQEKIFGTNDWRLVGGYLLDKNQFWYTENGIRHYWTLKGDRSKLWRAPLIGKTKDRGYGRVTISVRNMNEF